MELESKILVKTKLGNKICVIDDITETTVHFKNKKCGLTVNKNRIRKLSKTYRGAKYVYVSFN